MTRFCAEVGSYFPAGVDWGVALLPRGLRKLFPPLPAIIGTIAPTRKELTRRQTTVGGGGAVTREGTQAHIRIYTYTRVGVYVDIVCLAVVATDAFGAQKSVYTVGVEASDSVCKNLRIYTHMGVYGCVSMDS